VKALNPDIIMVSSCLMGQTGPWSPYAGYGNLSAAVSGFHALTGHRDMPPTGCFGPYTDFTSVRFNALAILAAVKHRASTGDGQFIDMSQAEAALHFLAPDCLTYFETGLAPQALGNRDRGHAPSGVYPVQGFDRWIAISVLDDQQWLSLCAMAGFEDLLEEGLIGLMDRRRREDAIDERLADWTAGQEGPTLEASLQQRGIPAHCVLDTHDLFHDAQLNHRGHFIGVEHRDFDGAVVESSRLKFSELSPRLPVYAPWFGIDNHRVLREVLGYDDARIAGLEAENILS
jgi:crotonobetainyl-CoA:carnitine CoA-transferase CaiB-like acyl-CoA transferase